MEKPSKHRTSSGRCGRVRRGLIVGVLALLAVGPAQVHAGADNVGQNASNVGGMVNTRHNLTQSYLGGGTAASMDFYRNDYGEICVYCHTPHGASASLAAPLWNHTKSSASYTLYDSVSLTQTPDAPGVNSLTCLSCHDGTVGIDSIINMPGSGRYDQNQETVQNNTFLENWPQAGTQGHSGLNSNPPGGGGTGCMLCHTPTSGVTDADDFGVFVIGTDLTNDHPVGITRPGTPDYNTPAAPVGDLQFFDNGSGAHAGNGRADTDEIRFYNTGGNYKVECASCHDPHGVDGGGGTLISRFLRVTNAGSNLCLTCHNQ